VPLSIECSPTMATCCKRCSSPELSTYSVQISLKRSHMVALDAPILTSDVQFISHWIRCFGSGVEVELTTCKHRGYQDTLRHSQVSTLDAPKMFMWTVSPLMAPGTKKQAEITTHDRVSPDDKKRLLWVLQYAVPLTGPTALWIPTCSAPIDQRDYGTAHTTPIRRTHCAGYTEGSPRQHLGVVVTFLLQVAFGSSVWRISNLLAVP
jgi:hypothetical protein